MRLAEKLEDLGELGAEFESAFKRLDSLRVVAGFGQKLPKSEVTQLVVWVIGYLVMNGAP